MNDLREKLNKMMNAKRVGIRERMLPNPVKIVRHENTDVAMTEDLMDVVYGKSVYSEYIYDTYEINVVTVSTVSGSGIYSGDEEIKIVRIA